MTSRLIKRLISGALALTLVFSINGFAAVVTDNDGSAFITKAEFDSLKNSFQAQIDSYNQAIDSKIDGAIAAYLNGIKITTTRAVTPKFEDAWACPIAATSNGRYGYVSRYTNISAKFNLIRRNGFRKETWTSGWSTSSGYGAVKRFTWAQLQPLFNSSEITAFTNFYVKEGGYSSLDDITWVLMKPNVRNDLWYMKWGWEGALSWLSGHITYGGTERFIIDGCYDKVAPLVTAIAGHLGNGQDFKDGTLATHTVATMCGDRGDSASDYKFKTWDSLPETYEFFNKDNWCVKQGHGVEAYVNIADAITTTEQANQYQMTSSTYNSTSTMTYNPSLITWSNSATRKKLNVISMSPNDKFFIGFAQENACDDFNLQTRWQPEFQNLRICADSDCILVGDTSNQPDKQAWADQSKLDWSKVIWPVWTFADGLKGTDLDGNTNISERGSLNAKWCYTQLKWNDGSVENFNLAQGLPLFEMDTAGDLEFTLKFKDASDASNNYVLDQENNVQLPANVYLMFSKNPKTGINEWWNDTNLLSVKVNNIEGKKLSVNCDGTDIHVRINALDKGDKLFMNWCATDFLLNNHICHGILEDVKNMKIYADD